MKIKQSLAVMILMFILYESKTPCTAEPQSGSNSMRCLTLLQQITSNPLLRTPLRARELL